MSVFHLCLNSNTIKANFGIPISVDIVEVLLETFEFLLGRFVHFNLEQLKQT